MRYKNSELLQMMFAELQEALAGGRALNKSERLIASSAPGHKHRPSTSSPSSSIPGGG